MATATYIKPEPHEPVRPPEGANATQLAAWAHWQLLRIVAAMRALWQHPSFDVVLIENVALTSGSENRIEHGLGRAVRGFRVAGLNQPAFVWQNPSTSADLAIHLPLLCSMSCTVTLEVF